MEIVGQVLLDKGDKIKGDKYVYEIIREFEGGANKAFEVKIVDLNKKAFLKIYENEPRAKNPRFNEFREQQAEVRKRLLGIISMTENLIEDFIYKDLYYCQVMDWLEGKSAEDIIEHELISLEFNKRLGLATVFLGVLSKVHELEIVHSDLKPANLFFERDDSIELKWKLRIADFDFAFIEGKEPFKIVFTRFYQSPEHIKGQIPTRKSDVFTAGIIIAELLTGGNIYCCGCDDGTIYTQHVLNKTFDVKVLEFIENKYKAGNSLVNLLVRMLDPDEKKRPNAEEAHGVLASAFAEELSSIKIPKRIELHALGKRLIIFEDKISLNRDLFYIFGKDNAMFLDRRKQFDILKSDEGWKLVAASGTTNKTLYNGKALLDNEEVLLKESDKIKIGPLELTVKFS